MMTIKTCSSCKLTLHLDEFCNNKKTKDGKNNRCRKCSAEYDKRYRTPPFGPSIDKKDPSKGYTLDNIQIVCFMVNMGKSEYTQETFDEMCIARAKVLGYEKT